jgi:predicted HTH domain antitoxin
MSLQFIQVQDLVAARLYENEEQVVQDAFRHFLLDRPDLRIRVAVHRYRTDEELSLARAAAIAGVSLERMKEILDHHGVPLRLGPASIEEAQAEGTTLEEWLDAGPD